MLRSDALAGVVAHAGEPVRPHDVLTAWELDPVVVIVLIAVSGLYVRGYRPARDGRVRSYAMGGGLVAVALALLSPIDPMASVLLSAHMVQHVLLVTVAAPLIAVAAPGPAIMQGLPRRPRRAVVATRRSVGLDVTAMRRLRHPVARWLAFVATFWLWHASLLYGAAVDHELVHVAEHLAFFGTALLLWTSIVGPDRLRVPDGAGILVVFLLALQGVLLAALMTFAPSPWYGPYRDPAPGWDVHPLTDQHLAGVIMWVPSGIVYTGVAIALLVRWLRDVEAVDVAGRRVDPGVRTGAVIGLRAAPSEERLHGVGTSGTTLGAVGLRPHSGHQDRRRGADGASTGRRQGAAPSRTEHLDGIATHLPPVTDRVVGRANSDGIADDLPSDPDHDEVVSARAPGKRGFGGTADRR